MEKNKRGCVVGKKKKKERRPLETRRGAATGTVLSERTMAAPASDLGLSETCLVKLQRLQL